MESSVVRKSITLAKEDSPGISLKLAPEGSESKLNVTVAVPEAVSNEYTADTFEASVADNEGTLTTLTVDVTYDDIEDQTVITVTAPGSTIVTNGTLGLRWTSEASEKKWIVSGSYDRKHLIP